MVSYLDQLTAGVTRSELAGQHLLLAVSGGPDSIAMLRGLHALAGKEKLRLRAAHLNHHLRENESQADADWLVRLCKSLKIELSVGDRDVAAIAETTGLGIEETARSLRYEFLQQVAEQENCTHIVVAHTADDQAETILHHILRGTGVAGLSGMPERRRLGENLELVRPLLEITREQVEAYLTDIGQAARTDETNLDMRFTRNRLRRSLLPLLQREYNPQVAEALRKLGQQAREFQDVLESLSRELLSAALEDRNETTVRINCDQLSDSPRHLIRECCSLLWKELDWPRRKMGFGEWDRLAELVLNGGRATLPGAVEAVRRGNLLVLRRV